MKFYWLLLGALSVYRITHLLHAEDGPWDLSARLRRAAGSGFFARLLDCSYCLSLWIAAPVALAIGDAAQERVLVWLSLSAAVVLLDRRASRGEPPAVYWDKEAADELLRREEGALSK
jgi:hypothetical protein